MTKDQYDHIRHLIITSPTIDYTALEYGINQSEPERIQRRHAICYLAKICIDKTGVRILHLCEMLDIVKKIQTKLGYKS